MEISELARFLYEDIDPRVIAVRRIDDALEIDIACDALPRGERRFRITAEEVLEDRLVPASFESLSVHEDHPLLFDWRGDSRSLAFASAPENPDAVVGRLYEAHERICGDWRPFSNYVNSCYGRGLTTLLKTGSGILANGPGPVLQAYQEAISGLLKTSLTVPGPSWREDFKALLFGDQYVLARGFRSEEITVPSNPDHPSLDLGVHREVVAAFVRELQEAIDTGDADLFNRRFAGDVLWGSPFGAVAPGYDVIHAIHARMFGSVPARPGAARFEVEHVSSPSQDVVLAYVRRTAQGARAEGGPGSFDELALFVLAKRDGEWWLAAAQHVPDRRDVYATK